MPEKKFRIKDIHSLAKRMLSMGAEELGMDEKRRNKYINLTNVEGIIKEHATYKEANDSFYITDSAAELVVDDIMDWLLGVEVAEMCSKGKLECYWDDMQNCMVFKTID